MKRPFKPETDRFREPVPIFMIASAMLFALMIFNPSAAEAYSTRDRVMSKMMDQLGDVSTDSDLWSRFSNERSGRVLSAIRKSDPDAASLVRAANVLASGAQTGRMDPDDSPKGPDALKKDDEDRTPVKSEKGKTALGGASGGGVAGSSGSVLLSDGGLAIANVSQDLGAILGQTRSSASVKADPVSGREMLEWLYRSALAVNYRENFEMAGFSGSRLILDGGVAIAQETLEPADFYNERRAAGSLAKTMLGGAV